MRQLNWQPEIKMAHIKIIGIIEFFIIQNSKNLDLHTSYVFNK